MKCPNCGAVMEVEEQGDPVGSLLMGTADVRPALDFACEDCGFEVLRIRGVPPIVLHDPREG